MAASIRGDKNHVRILKNGEQVAWFEITNVDSSEDSQNIESYFCGQREPETDTLMMGYSGTIQGEVKNDAVDQLIQEIRDARKSGVALPSVQLLIHEEYGDEAGTPATTFLYTDVQLTYGSHRFAGMQEKVQKTLNFKASDRRII